MPKLVRFLLENAVVGIIAGWVLLAYLLFSDRYGLGTLVFHAVTPAMPIIMLMIGFAITFGSAAMGIAIMTLSYLQDGSGGKRNRIATILSYLVVNTQLVKEPATIPMKTQD